MKMFVCLFVLRLKVSVKSFSVMSGRSQRFLGLTILEPHREKTGFCLGENKGADQLRGNREADQRLCFRYTDSTISLLLKSKISSF